MSEVNFRYGDYVKEGVEVFKANLVPCIVGMILCGVPILGMIVMINFLEAIKKNKGEGTPIDIGALLNFDNAVDKIVVCIITGIGFQIFFVPGALIYFGPAILADKPGTPFMNAVKGSLAFGKANLVPSIITAIVVSIVAMVGCILLGIGMLITGPIALTTYWLAYQDAKTAIEAAAAQDGVQI